MTVIAWASDTHFEFASEYELLTFHRQLRDAKTDMLLLTGDIANGRTVFGFLSHLVDEHGIPVYYVLGNHDYYGRTITDVRTMAGKYPAGQNGFRWMPEAGVIELSARVCMVGVDGWADARLGHPQGDAVGLADWEYIGEMKNRGIRYDVSERIKMLNNLGDEEARTLRPLLRTALETYEHVILMTHIPPWKEATWHEGKHSDDDWLPWFSCYAVGQEIELCAADFPGKKITVLTGHTHGRGYSKITPRIDVYTAGAKYGSPALAGIITIDADVVSVNHL